MNGGKDEQRNGGNDIGIKKEEKGDRRTTREGGETRQKERHKEGGRKRKEEAVKNSGESERTGKRSKGESEGEGQGRRE